MITILYFYFNIAFSQESKPCRSDEPIHIKELIDAMNSGCYLAPGTSIIVGIKEVFEDQFKKKLDQLILFLKNKKSIRLIAIEIHPLKTNNIDEEIENAKNTGKDILEYLIQNGIESSRIEVRVMESSEKAFVDIKIIRMEG